MVSGEEQTDKVDSAIAVRGDPGTGALSNAPRFYPVWAPAGYPAPRPAGSSEHLKSTCAPTAVLVRGTLNLPFFYPARTLRICLFFAGVHSTGGNAIRKATYICKILLISRELAIFITRGSLIFSDTTLLQQAIVISCVGIYSLVLIYKFSISLRFGLGSTYSAKFYHALDGIQMVCKGA